ncbi:MAG: T9SS type A sorting domain-containing protein [Candidatus Eisenbacteria bacterium]|nr:T9SS type A sorting domain-containing protein [Candidatus Eisenbacteria bacterium]
MIAAWGYNNYGQCSVPQPNTGYIAVAAGAWYSLGLSADGAVTFWGLNEWGVGNLPSPNGPFESISTGGSHALALKPDGSIVAWGSNSHAQCDVPEPNAGFVGVSGGIYHSLGLKADGSIVGWGDNGHGECDVPAPNSGFVAISAGWRFSVGLKEDGSVVVWGSNLYGEHNPPNPNLGFSAIGAGHSHAVALRGPLVWPENAHAYELVSTLLTWEEARLAAEGRVWNGVLGHLATVTSPEENAFVFEQVLRDGGEAWLGGYQDPPSSPPADDWHWVTGEPWDFAEWGSGEPNDYYGAGSESFLSYYGSPNQAQRWNDLMNDAHGPGFPLLRYIVEYDLNASGACCSPGGNCTVQTESGCGLVGGTYIGHGTNCEHDPCAAPTGACCLVLFCTTMNQADCTANGGTYQGNGVLCVPEICATSGIDPTTPAVDFAPRAMPNPSAGRTAISFSLPRSGPTSVEIYDAGGRLVRVLDAREMAAGGQSLVWDGRDDAGRGVASGLYFARVTTRQREMTSPVVVAR